MLQEEKLVAIRTVHPRSVAIFEIPVGIRVEYWIKDALIMSRTYPYYDDRVLDRRIQNFLLDEEQYG